MTKMQDLISKDVKKTQDRLADFKDAVDVKLAGTKEDYTERFSDYDNVYQEEFAKLDAEISAVRSIARDSVNAKEKELTDLMDKNVAKIQGFVDENIGDMIEERRSTLTKYEKQFS